ncbi:MAG: hypothetical protein EXS47_01570, partial [Candidatus Zambryskibacteria bacterium]|nr:hypothetical protein [Candidatus Zambryskibacteria bacterium]
MSSGIFIRFVKFFIGPKVVKLTKSLKSFIASIYSFRNILVNKSLYFSLVLCVVILFNLFSGFIGLVSVASAATGVPTILSYQGRLTNASGDLVGGAGTSYYFKFSIWDNSVVLSGTKLWPTNAPTSFTSTVRQGVFNVNIGDTANSYPDTLDYNFNTNKNIFLQIEVSADNVTFETLSPRQQISATAFAQISAAVSGTGQSSFGTTTPITNSVLTIEATSTSAIGALIRGYSGQIANLFRIEDSVLNNLFSISASGGIFASSTLNISGVANLYSSLNVLGQSIFTQASSTAFSSLDYLTVGRTATTTIRGETNATSTFAGGIQGTYLNLTGTSATSTFANGLIISNGGIKLASLNCSASGELLQTDSAGNIVCGVDDTGVGGGIATIQENDVDVTTVATVLDFLGADFNVTGATVEGNVAIDYTNSGIT